MKKVQRIRKQEAGNFIKFTVRLEVDIRPLNDDSGDYLAYCPILDVSSQGDNHDHALEMLKEAVHLFIETAYEMNTLDEILKESGFIKSALRRPTISKTKAKAKESIEVPFSLVAARGLGIVPEVAAC